MGLSKATGLSSVYTQLFATYLFVVFFAGTTDLHAELSESNVLVLFSEDHGQAGSGNQIAEYYQQIYPGIHIAGINGIDRVVQDDSGEIISADDYLDVIRPQVLEAIESIPDSIEVIVTTKGLPLKIYAGAQSSTSSSANWRPWSSLESELTRIDSIDSVDLMGDQFIFTGFPEFDSTLGSNPYYNQSEPFVRSGSDPFNEDIRLVSRLDGYDVDDVKSLIDKSQNAYVMPNGHYFVVDDDPTAGVDQFVDDVVSGPGPGLVNHLSAVNQPFIYDNTDDALLTAPGPVLGYVSHGTNDGDGGLAQGYIEDQLQLNLADGAVFLTHESYNATSFDESYEQNQGLVADWLKIGGTAGLGHVQEPFNGSDNVANEDLFYQMMLPPEGALPGESGLTFVEAAWSATRQLSYVNTVIGDPLMRWRLWLAGDANLDGIVDGADTSLVISNWDSVSPSLSDGDVNGDGHIDSADIGIVFDNWSNPLPVAASAVALPEPASLMLFSLGLGAAFLARRRRLA